MAREVLHYEFPPFRERPIQWVWTLLRESWHQFMRDECQSRSAALSYSTLLSFVPLLAIALMVVAYFGNVEGLVEEAQNELIELILPFTAESDQPTKTVSPRSATPAVSRGGPPPRASSGGTPTLDAPQSAESKAAAIEQSDTFRQLRSLIDENLKRFIENARNVGIVGAVFLVLIALFLAQSIENNFNLIWYAPRRRSITRFVNYWGALTLTPLFIFASFAATAGMSGNPVFETLNSLQFLVPLLFSFLGFTTLYLIVPTVRVRMGAAAAGGMVTALLWEIAKWGFRLYIKNNTGLQDLYGSIAVIPIMLIWLYYTWMVIFFGLEVSYVVHYALARGRREEVEVVAFDDKTMEELEVMRDRIEELMRALKKAEK